MTSAAKAQGCEGGRQEERVGQRAGAHHGEWASFVPQVDDVTCDEGHDDRDRVLLREDAREEDDGTARPRGPAGSYSAG